MKIKYMTYDMSFGKVKFSAFLPPSTSSVIPIGMLDMRSTFAWLKRMDSIREYDILVPS